MGANFPQFGECSREVAAVQQLSHMLGNSASYRAMDPAARSELDSALGKIAGFLEGGAGPARALGGPLATQMAPDLRAAIGTGGTSSNAPPATGDTAPSANGSAPPASGNSGSATSRVGEVARATLNAINFPEFVASLIQGTFQAIVDASIQQMEAYAELLKNVSGTVDRFMQDNITDGTAKDYLADQYGSVFSRDTSAGKPRLVVNNSPGQELPSFFKDLGFNAPQDIDDQAVEQVIVPATRQELAQRRQQTLATMVLMGINRVVVKDGEISAKLMFHIDASEATQMKFDQNKVSNGNMSGYAGRNPFGAASVMVNTASLNAQSNLNVRADLTGQVTIRFASETFPLERFADSAAIQLINQNARVPESRPAAPGTPPGPAATSPVPAALPQPTPAVPAPVPKAPAAQGLAAVDFDPWAP